MAGQAFPLQRCGGPSGSSCPSQLLCAPLLSPDYKVDLLVVAFLLRFASCRLFDFWPPSFLFLAHLLCSYCFSLLAVCEHRLGGRAAFRAKRPFSERSLRNNCNG